jgi:hypothetical protein
VIRRRNADDVDRLVGQDLAKILDAFRLALGHFHGLLQVRRINIAHGGDLRRVEVRWT